MEPRDEVHSTRLCDTLMRVLERMISPRSLDLDIQGEEWFQHTAIITIAADADGHILGVLISLLLAAATGRLDLAIAGLFGAGKSRAAAVVLIAMPIVNPQVKLMVICKENSAARSFVQLIEGFKPPEQVLQLIGRVVSDDETSAHALSLDIPPARRNSLIPQKAALIGTGGIFAGELKNRWSVLNGWPKDLTIAFVEEAQQYGAVNEVVVVVRLLHRALLAFGGDRRQTPGGLNKAAQGTELALQKFLTRQYCLRLSPSNSYQRSWHPS